MDRPGDKIIRSIGVAAVEDDETATGIYRATEKRSRGTTIADLKNARTDSGDAEVGICTGKDSATATNETHISHTADGAVIGEIGAAIKHQGPRTIRARAE